MMNKNQENFKKSIDEIHASDELKKKTFEKMTKPKDNKFNFTKIISMAAVFVVVLTGGVFFYKTDKEPNNIVKTKNNNIAKNVDEDLPRFESIEQLKKVLAKSSRSRNVYSSFDDMAITESAVDTTTKGDSVNSELSEAITDVEYSKTNTQVENVDEADIVKTDGKYIYYTAQNSLYIVDSKDLKVISKTDFNGKPKSKERLNIQELFINDNKIILLANLYEYEYPDKTDEDVNYTNEDVIIDPGYYYGGRTSEMAVAIVYNISDKSNPKEERRVALDGYYSDSRMIGDNIYFLSKKSIYYYNDIDDNQILPRMEDTVKSDECVYVDVTDIAYFRNSTSSSYLMCAGFNINDNEEACIETICGDIDVVYASEKNLYVGYSQYTSAFGISTEKTTIFKFGLEDSKITLKCKGKILGNLNDQFSMDEYNGNLRIATTNYNSIISDYTNKLYILDENLEQIGALDSYALGERIYSVRFMGDVGYVVTFEQIDPLFVMDLSDPTNPQIKGELKIPGYSSYLHPYDETHIIGIGYNTKSNGYGGVTNANMKMSMFDVSDLENPKELFSVDIGDKYAYSDIINNHKCLFYNKSEDLIGFPVTYRGYDYRVEDKDAFVIFKIDLNKGFEKFGEITQAINYRTNISRAIYIKDILYTLSETKIVSYDLNTMEKKDELDLEEKK